MISLFPNSIVRAIRILMVALCVLMLNAVMLAQAPAPAGEETLTGEAVINKYIAAVGGQEKLDKIQNRYMKASMDIPSAGIKLAIELYLTRAGKMYTVASAEALGKMESGSDGAVFWENSLVGGPRIIEGPELAESKRDATLDLYSSWQKYFDKVEFAGVDTVGGQRYKVVMTPKEGNPQTLFFDAQTGLITKVEAVLQHQMGNVPLVTTLDDYREVEGIKLPFQTKITVMGQERTLVVEEIKHNIEMPDSLFVIPTEVQALMKK